MDDKSVYLKAARIVANCPKSRLPEVLGILKQGGIEIDAEEVNRQRNVVGKKKSTLQSQRSEQSKEKFHDTDDPCVLKLREAYDLGLSFTHLGRVVGLDKSTIYKYLYADRLPSPAMKTKIITAIDEWIAKN
jgi:predicted DNA-binding transcriptional regulator AlpA